MSDEIDSFVAVFKPRAPLSQRTADLAARSADEKRSQMSEAQLKRVTRGATRTTQINFRASPAFKKQVADLAAERGESVADLFEAAVAALVAATTSGSVQ